MYIKKFVKWWGEMVFKNGENDHFWTQAEWRPKIVIFFFRHTRQQGGSGRWGMVSTTTGDTQRRHSTALTALWTCVHSASRYGAEGLCWTYLKTKHALLQSNSPDNWHEQSAKAEATHKKRNSVWRKKFNIKNVQKKCKVEIHKMYIINVH